MNKLLSKLLFLFLLIVMVNITAFSQQRNTGTPQPVKRCATEEAIEARYRTDPQFKAMMEQRERSFQLWKQLNPNGAASPLSLTGPVTIPVVVHVVLPNPNIILESDVDYFINRMNLDFSGLNPDSTNGVSFYGVRGHSLLRFCLARRDPSGNFTNGIERRVGAGNIGGGEPQAIKSFASGGLNPWNTSLYYNVWIGQGGGLLGIAPEIGPGTAASDGVCINYQAFANNPCYTIGAFNLGRTGIHEIGHNFGLYHTFQGACANGDNGQLTTASCVLPGSILSLPDQTPALSAATSGCPTGNVAAGCASSPNPPGKQYQNYMDYTDDACYSMFTNTQVERMHWVTENCRPGYLTSNGCQLPAGLVALDGALIETVSPGGSELVGCTVVTYNVSGCVGTFTPKVRVQNRGTTTLTSVTVQLTLNGTPLAAQTLALSNLPYGKSQVVSLNNATLISGNNTISFAITGVNGGADGNAANNTLASNYSFAPPTTSPLPFAQDFVAATFPPTNMTVVNPNANNTWVRNANGNLTVGSAFIDNYNFNLVGQVDELRTGLLAVPAGVDSLILTFDLAHKNFPGLNDRLQVLISSDCGGTFTATGTNPVFDRSGATLATAGSSTANYTAPVAADWKNQRVAIFVGAGSPFAGGGNIMIAFKETNGYGNNIFLDNINCNPKTSRDLRVSAVTKPGASECTTVAPEVTVSNGGAETITSYKVAYKVDNNPEVVSATISTPLAPGATANFTLASFTTTPGSHTFRAYPKDPVSVSGSGEQVPGNDTMTVAFNVAVPVATATPASQAVCNGNAITTIALSSTVPGTTFSWTRTNTTNVTGIPASGTTNISGTPVNTTGVSQTVTFTITPTVGNCSGAAITASFVIHPLPTVSLAAQGPVALTPGQTVNLVATVNPTGGTFVWFKNNAAIVTNTTGTLARTVDDVGIYRVRYTDPNGCVAESGNIELTAAPSPGIWVYPNPNNGIFNVRFFNTLSAPATLNVFDARGAKVFTKTYELAGPYARMEVDLRHANTGQYTVELMQKTGKRINTKKILIMR